MTRQSKRERLGATAGVRAKYNDDGLNGVAAEVDRKFRAWCLRNGYPEDEHAGYYATKRRKKTEREEI